MKLNLISAAAAAVVDKAQRELANREAAYRLPVKQAMKDLAAKLALDLDAALLVAIERQLGHVPNESEVVGGRLQVIRHPDDPGDTYYFDGAPILWRGPVELSRDSDEMRATQALRLLQNLAPADVAETPRRT